MKNAFALIIVLAVSGCYHVSYTAHYTVRSKPDTSVETDVARIANNLADTFELFQDKKMTGDTLLYTGIPYYWFTFIVSEKSGYSDITFKYHGALHGKRKNPPYKKLRENFSDSIHHLYTVDKEFVEIRSNEK